MELTVLESDATRVRAGYSCPCGCTPSVEYVRDNEPAEEGCCCGNHFAVGPRAAAGVVPRPGFRTELQTFDAPWGERLEAAWLVGPSVHGPGEIAGGDHDHEHHGDTTVTSAIDPVCGMAVERAAADATGLRSSYRGVDYYFCGRGCKLEFGDDPDRYLAPGYAPSM
jgi:YHS domain-containing protein